MIKKSLAFLMAVLILLTTVYPVNAAGNGQNARIRILTEDASDAEAEDAYETSDEPDGSESYGEEDLTEDNREDVSESDSEGSTDETAETDSEANTEEETEIVSEENTDEITEEPSEENTEELTETVPDESAESTFEFSEEQKQARDVLCRLAETEDLMALVYLTDSYEVRLKPDDSAEKLTTVYSGQTVFVCDIALTEGVIWYEVRIADEEGLTGYIEKCNLIYSNELLLAWEEEYLACFRADDSNMLDEPLYGTSETSAEAAAFPESYRSYIEEMQKAHPNWHFVPFNINEDFDTAAANQVGERSLIHSSVDDSWKGDYHSPNWYYATPFIIRHYMDPRNFLDERSVFQFEQLTYNKSYHNVGTVSQLLSKSFMAGDIPNEGVTYAATFMQAGIESSVSPYHLASRVMQEQGAGTSGLISGTYSGYEGYYNYFNINASGTTTAEIIKNGLKYAKEKGWNTRFKSIVGGSQFIGNGYIKVGQDTLYLQKFDMVGDFYTHQYMQNIMAPTTEGRSIQSAYSSAGALDKSFVFKVPVYRNMPLNPCPDKQGVITLMRKVEDADGKISYQTCKTYTEDKNGPYIQLAPFFDDDDEPANYNDFTWTSSDPAVAPVYGDGCVEFLKPGTATITAVYKGSNSTYKGKKATCKITVYGIWFEGTGSKEATNYSLRVGSNHTVSTVVKIPSGVKDKALYWSVGDETVATVNTKGVVSGVSVGVTTLTLTVGNYTQTAELMVLPQSFETQKEIYYMERQETEQIAMKVSGNEIPESLEGILKYTYESDNPAVATVSENGVITAVTPGEATIRITALGFTTTCRVNVAAELLLVNKLESNVEEKRFSIPYGVACGEIFEEFVQEERDDAVFVGWYGNEDGTGIQYTPQTILYGDATAYAFYREVTDSFFVKPVSDMIYTGAALKPAVEVYDGSVLLVEGRDYSVSYKNNTNVTTDMTKKATITVKGKGNYSGSQSVTFNILPLELDTPTITAENLLVKATGKKITTKPTLKLGKKKLSYNKDYTLEWREVSENAYKVPGTYEIVAVGKKNYTGERKITITITEAVLASKLTISSIAKQTYKGGEAVCPNITVKYKSKVLMEGTDYSVSFLNNKEIGTATVVIRGMGDYVGEKTKNFTIEGYSLKKAKITGIVNRPYTGEEIIQQAILKYEGKDLIEGVDYTVAYEKNIKAGKATIVYTGINAYTGTVKKTYTITPYVLSENEDMSLAEVAAHPYTKGGAKPKVTLLYKGMALVEGVDYTLSYKNNKKVTESGLTANKLPQVVVKGKGNFKGSLTTTFEILQGNLGAVKMEVEDATYTTKANGYCKKPVLKDTDGKTLQAGKDYEKTITYTYADGSEILQGQIPEKGAVIRVTVQGKGSYTGNISAEYRIVEQSFTKAKITIKQQVYTGNEIVPPAEDITIRFGKEDALTTADYEIVSVENNVNKGTATITLRGRGNYGGVKKVKFKITTKVLFL